jgi:hypothetical protein
MLKDVPLIEQTLKNKEVAISFAAFRTMNEYYYRDTTMFREFMKELGWIRTINHLM